MLKFHYQCFFGVTDDACQLALRRLGSAEQLELPARRGTAG